MNWAKDDLRYQQSQRPREQGLPHLVQRDSARRDPPAAPEDLRKSFYTMRKKDLIEFEFGDSGKTAYFAVQLENGGKKGPWGPMVSVLIP